MRPLDEGLLKGQIINTAEFTRSACVIHTLSGSLLLLAGFLVVAVLKKGACS